MKNKYLDLMEEVLTSYSDAHILRYFEDVKRDGLTEHGFPRLTANIGILISHGKRVDLLGIFTKMMDFCCEQFLRVKAANDFSVREIVCCIKELEKSDAVEEQTINKWKEQLRAIQPEKCYDVFAKTSRDDVRNWALFTAVSEFARQSLGGCDSTEFIDLQIASQLQWIDENGMYMDNEKEKHHQPLAYDIVSRALFSMLLHFGYRGRFYETISELLKKAALLMLQMQSTSGEIPFGGRSNQFLNNEGFFAAICEFEASRYFREGNLELASTFKGAANRAYTACMYWLEKKPIRHVKNRFPTETKFGCELYAYFDKYMITTASTFYAAYIMCDDTIPTCTIPDVSPMFCQTSKFFHKIHIKSGGYALEFDTNGDPEYDASGLGRIHRADAPPAICLSVPCARAPLYTLSIRERTALSLCPGIKQEGSWYFRTDASERSWYFATDGSVRYEISKMTKDETSVCLTLLCHFPSEETVEARYTVNESGVTIEVFGKGEIAYLLPALCFDGETCPVIRSDEHSLSIEYEGWCCRYTTNGVIQDQKKLAENRNGRYQVFAATAQDKMKIHVEIVKC